MKVDMSPEAVAGRLDAMGQLWQLSVELMKSKTLSGKMQTRQRGLEIQDSIRRVLIVEWAPIGVSDIPRAADEYDAYIAPLYRILVGSRSEDDLVECLRRIERDDIGLGPVEAESLRPVAKKLLELKVRLDQG